RRASLASSARPRRTSATRTPKPQEARSVSARTLDIALESLRLRSQIACLWVNSTLPRRSLKKLGGSCCSARA
ncbi:hypothetical protein BG005_011097, partial [Podila minutissima]